MRMVFVALFLVAGPAFAAGPPPAAVQAAIDEKTRQISILTARDQLLQRQIAAANAQLDALKAIPPPK